MRLTVIGQVPSLKNSKQLFKNSKTGKTFITSSLKSKEWVETAKWQIKGKPRVTSYPIAVTMTFYFQGNHRKDLDNAASSVLDVLRDDPKKGWVGIIEDDDWRHINKLTVLYGGVDKLNPRVELEIE